MNKDGKQTVRSAMGALAGLAFLAFAGMALAGSPGEVPTPPVLTQAVFSPPVPAPKPRPPESTLDFARRLLMFRNAPLRHEDSGSAAAEAVLAATPPLPDPKPRRVAETATPAIAGVSAPSSSSGRPVPESDIALYRDIFRAQENGNWKDADGMIARLHDPRLLGHVLYQRYMHPTAYKASFTELQTWMRRYADQPGAARIYRLALSRRPEGSSAAVKQPVGGSAPAALFDQEGSGGKPYRSARKRTAAQSRAVSSLMQKVRAEAGRGAPSAALRFLQTDGSAKLLDATEYDIARSQIALGFLHSGSLGAALSHASAAANRSGVRAPLAGWVAGLITWRQEKYEEAARYFEMVARSPQASAWTASAGGYWASRAHMRAGNVRAVSYWLQKASSHPRTFYGLIAMRALGRDFAFNWRMPEFTSRHAARIAAIPAGARALALAQAGQTDLADAELRRINPGRDSALRDAMLAFAAKEGLASFSLKMASTMPAPDGGPWDAALYPLGPWQPKDGYKVDPALINAIIRQESRFDPAAENRSGATGLMQIMPRTASFMAGPAQKARGQDGLLDPQVNLDIGQDYIRHLLEQESIGGDLFSLAIAYNAGPGNLAKWKERLRGIDDPLLFIESIPVGQTRAYVERVLSNYWIYRLRLGQPTPSLDAVASGQWARYAAQDEDAGYQLASR